MLSETEKERRKRERMLAKFGEYTLGTAKNKVATGYQRMIRAEAAAMPAGNTPAIVDGHLVDVYRCLGQCVCVTCGKVGHWKGESMGGGVIETGHFLASRAASIIFEESNTHPQCKLCNRHLDGNQSSYEMWMQTVFGPDEIDRLRRLKSQVRQFTREELVDLKIEYKRRLDIAVEAILNWSS